MIGLEEVPLWRTGPLGSPSPSASNVAFDALQSLSDALAQQGQQYTVIATVSEYDVEGPTVSGFDIRLTDRDVILARTDLTTDLSNVQEHHFSHNFVVNTFAGQVTILRGWASVDANIRSKTFRFVTTHLESVNQDTASAQAAELVQVASNTTLPVVIAGDFNSAAPGGGPDLSTAYNSMISAGFTDTWCTAHPCNPSDPGFDPGYTFPLHLEDPVGPSSPTERIDLVLSRGGVGVLGAQLVGNTTVFLTPSGLWPSDHAGSWPRCASRDVLERSLL